MHRWRAAIFCVLIARGVAFAQPTPSDGEYIIQSPTGVEYRDNIATITNQLSIRTKQAFLTADRGSLNWQTGDAEVEGNVRLEEGDKIVLAENLIYNFKTGHVLGKNVRTRHGIFLMRSEGMAGDRNESIYVGAKNIATTDDYSRPAYSLRAETIILVPDQYIEAKNATLRLGEVPVFYFPRFRRNLPLTFPPIEITPGYRTRFGAFLLLSYNWDWNEYLDGSLHLDGREKRGAAVGPEFNWHLPRWGEGSLRTYFAHDNEPGVDLLNRPIDDDRYRINVFHRMNPSTNLHINGVFRYQSDPLVVRDFFEGEYKANIQPSTFVEADQFWSNFSLDALVQPRVNDFFQTVERLPDIRLTGFRQQIGSSPLYYESESSFAYLQRKFGEGETNAPYSAMRADTFHQVVLPQTFFGWLTVTPRAGARFTHYSEAEAREITSDEEDRGVFNTGAEASFKASHLWTGAESQFWQVHGLRHIIEPSLNYAYVPHPTVPPRKLPQFDYIVPTSRLLPIEFPDFNAIDEIDSENVLRFGLNNKLQTKRKKQVQNIVQWELFADWRITHRTEEPSLSDLFSDLELRPFSWLTFNSELRYGLERTGVQESYQRLAIFPNDTWSAAIGHRYRRDNAELGDPVGQNVIATTLYYRINENWGTRMSHHYEARTGTLQEQYYTLYRDFRSWTGALTFRVHNNVGRPNDYTVAVTFNVKAFPRYDLNDDTIRPHKLLGR